MSTRRTAEPALQPRLGFVLAHTRRILPAPAWLWLEGALAEVRAGASSDRFAQLQAQVARHTRGLNADFPPEALAEALRLLPGWWPEHWTGRDLARAALTLSLPDIGGSGGQALFETWLDTADEGELIAGLRSLCLLPAGQRFLTRAEEGCRSNMKSVFEATLLDTPYPAEHFSELTWKQALLKSIFVGAPTWRIVGIDRRLSEDLARMALDYADERRSAGREIPPALWLLLGPHGGSRAKQALADLRQSADTSERLAACLALARAGDNSGFAQAVALEKEPRLRQLMTLLTHGPVLAGAFGVLADLPRGLSET
jgi:hypothetical protein